MPFPTTERLKNLIQNVSDQEQKAYYAHSIEDKVYAGVIKEIVYGSEGLECATTYLKVVSVQPTVADDGYLTFANPNIPPLWYADNADDDTRYDKVYVDNIPPVLI